jgi:ABC-type antimicrobial peptide transport system permease subunit
MRLIRQFVIEGLVIVAAGAGLGLLSSHWTMRILSGLIPTDMMAGMPYLDDLGFNPRVLMFALVIAVLATALFSLSPALRLSTLDVREGMAEGARCR